MKLPLKRALRAAETLCLLLITTGLFFQHLQAEQVRVRKPIYSILHMANSMDKIDQGLASGANAIQIDVEYLGNGEAYDVHYSETLCACDEKDCRRREYLDRILNYVRNTTRTHDAKYGRKLCLLVLRLQLGPVGWETKFKAGQYIAEKLVEHLWGKVDYWSAMNVLMSVKYAYDEGVIRGANDTIFKLMPNMVNKIGYDARDEGDLDKLKKMYSDLGIPGNYWQGDGSATCLLEMRSVNRLQTMLDQRDSRGKNRYAKKVYHWVIDVPISMKRSLQRGVDAIVTNRPGRLYRVLTRALNDTHRLATIVDNPWMYFDGWAPFLRMSSSGVEKLGDDTLD